MEKLYISGVGSIDQKHVLRFGRGVCYVVVWGADVVLACDIFVSCGVCFVWL